MKIILLFCVIFLSINTSYIFLKEGRKFCFFEDLMDDQTALVSYKCPILDPKFRNEMLKRIGKYVHNHYIGISTEGKKNKNKKIKSNQPRR
jgi:hypothetical protein